jgi:hypothetical protein
MLADKSDWTRYSLNVHEMLIAVEASIRGLDIPLLFCHYLSVER